MSKRYLPIPLILTLLPLRVEPDDMLSGEIAFPAGEEDGDSISPLFDLAGDEFLIPPQILKGVGYAESRWNQHPGTRSIDGGYGIMNLKEGWTLPLAGRLTGASLKELLYSPYENIRGAAAVLRYLADRMALHLPYPQIEPEDTLNWAEVLASYSGIEDRDVAGEYAFQILRFLRDGIFDLNLSGEEIIIEPQPIDLSLLPPSSSTTRARPDYSGASWVSAASCNYSNYSRGYGDISYVIIHVAQGSYSGTISWFQNCAAAASTHYVIRSSDGAITQMVEEEDVAWHAGNWTYNLYSIGYEHEGYVSDPSWFTDAMYRSSAALTAYICDKYGIPKDRNHIIGHNEVPGATHTDPGPYWDWDYYISLVNGGGSVPTTGDLVGYIRENDIYDSTAGISGATVTLHTGDSRTTDSTGFYTFYDLSAGTYTVTASAPGYLTASDTKEVQAGITNWKSIALTRIPSPLIEMDVLMESIEGQERDIFQDISSSGIFDLFRGQTATCRVNFTNHGSLDAGNFTAGIWIEEPFLTPLSYTVYTDYPDGGENTSPAMDDPGNPPPDAPPSEFTLSLGTLHQGETVTILLDVEGERYSIGSADHPDVRAWVRHIDDYYEKEGFFSEYNNVGGYQTFNGGDLRDYSETDVWEFSTSWSWDGISGEPSLEGWRAGNDITSLEDDVEEGILMVSVEGEDPYIFSPPLNIGPGAFQTLNLRMKHTSSRGRGELFYILEDDGQWDERKSVDFYSPGDGEFHEILLDLTPLFMGNSSIKGIRLDPPHDGGAASLEIDYLSFSIDPPESNEPALMDGGAGCSCSSMGPPPFTAATPIYPALIVLFLATFHQAGSAPRREFH